MNFKKGQNTVSKLSEKNFLLLHFFIYSIGLAGILKMASFILGYIFFSGFKINFNDWVIFYNPLKPSQLLAYFINCSVLFAYYVIAYLVIFKDNKPVKSDFYDFIMKNKKFAAGWLGISLFLNIILTLDIIIFTLLGSLLWIILIFLPFKYKIRNGQK